MENNQGPLINNTTLVSIELTAEQWANVLTGVDELPRRIAQPLVNIINAKMLKAAQDENGAKVDDREDEATPGGEATNTDKADEPLS